ncbi:MAG TPA: molybdate ABC transporter substrate-binding protein [Candidatus Sulfotelmatobacter sp.]|nr:molybdate ABC transporter substrate-binding protein [Candidatus Sulfotelmatobacter sp.]
MRRRLFLALIPLVLLATSSAFAAEKRTLRVAAAANLKDAADAIALAFQGEHADVEVKVTIGASGNFFAQIQNGAPFDLFLSADTEYPDKIVAAGLARAEDERVYAFGKLIAWLPPGSTIDLEKTGLDALGDRSVKHIAIANPAVAPFGRATEQAFKAAGIYDAVKDKLVLGTSVAQTSQFATTGAADVAFLPYSLTFSKELSGGKVFFVPEKLYARIEQSGVVLASSKEADRARNLLAFITGERGRAILTRFGYGLP